MDWKHARVVALGLLIGALLGHVLYEVVISSPAATTLAPAAVSQELPPGVAFNANPHPDCRRAPWPDIPQKCLRRFKASGAG